MTPKQDIAFEKRHELSSGSPEQVEQNLSAVNMLAERFSDLDDQEHTNYLAAFKERLENGLQDEGDEMATAQDFLETAPRPPEADDEIRDVLVELNFHKLEELPPEDIRRSQLVVLADVSKKFATLVDINNPNRVEYTAPQAQKLKQIEGAFSNRNQQDYFDDITPQDQILNNGEMRTQHQIAEESYHALLGYIEGEIASGDLDDDQMEHFRVARDSIHKERQPWKDQYDDQNRVLENIISMVGENNEQFSSQELRGSVRDCVGDKLDRLQEYVAIAEQSEDPYEPINICLSIKNGTAPIDSDQQFLKWKKARAERAQRREEARRQSDIDAARRTAGAIYGSDTSPTTNETVPASKSEKVIPEVDSSNSIDDEEPQPPEIEVNNEKTNQQPLLGNSERASEDETGLKDSAPKASQEAAVDDIRQKIGEIYGSDSFSSKQEAAPEQSGDTISGREQKQAKQSAPEQSVEPQNEAAADAPPETSPRQPESARARSEKAFLEGIIKNIPKRTVDQEIVKFARQNASRYGMKPGQLRQELHKSVLGVKMSEEAVRGIGQRAKDLELESSSGGIWEFDPNAGSSAGQVARKARKLLSDIISESAGALQT